MRRTSWRVICLVYLGATVLGMALAVLVAKLLSGAHIMYARQGVAILPAIMLVCAVVPDGGDCNALGLGIATASLACLIIALRTGRPILWGVIVIIAFWVAEAIWLAYRWIPAAAH